MAVVFPKSTYLCLLWYLYIQLCIILLCVLKYKIITNYDNYACFVALGLKRQWEFAGEESSYKAIKTLVSLKCFNANTMSGVLMQKHRKPCYDPILVNVKCAWLLINIVIKNFCYKYILASSYSNIDKIYQQLNNILYNEIINNK